VEQDLQVTPVPDRGTFDQDQEAMPSVSDLLNTVQREISHQATTRPYTTILVAAAAGYVLGGGIPRWALRMGATMGTRVAAARIMASLLDDV
jgi:hypothetical protein